MRHQTTSRSRAPAEVAGEMSLKWLGYASTADEERYLKRFLQVKPEGHRAKGRPRMTHQSHIKTKQDCGKSFKGEEKARCTDKSG